MQDVPAAVHEFVRAQHPDLPDAVTACADRVAARWDGDAATDRDRVVGPLRAELREAGLLERFPSVLVGAVDAAGYDLPATPVAAPPYVVVTGRGPLLRATLPDGRLVVRFDVFAVERAGAVRYVRADGDPLAVAFHRD